MHRLNGLSRVLERSTPARIFITPPAALTADQRVRGGADMVINRMRGLEDRSSRRSSGLATVRDPTRPTQTRSGSLQLRFR